MKDLMNKEIDTAEMNKLVGLLCLAEIPHEITECWGTPQIWYPSAEEPVCDVICHSGSYGHEEGLLEIMGLVDKDHGDSVEGYLTAREVFRRILNHYLSE
jgi:hypothetical protein